jgi:hypothetical protein
VPCDLAFKRHDESPCVRPLLTFPTPRDAVAFHKVERAMAIDPQFERDRASQDMKQANENARASGQAAVLINGGAATAILAYLSKDTGSAASHTASGLLSVAPWSLVFYAVGVICGAMVMWCHTWSLSRWGHYHEARADDDFRGEYSYKTEGETWTGRGNRLFGISIGFFAAASLLMSLAFWATRIQP